MKRIKAFVILFVMAFTIPSYSQQKGIAEGRLINRTDPSMIAHGVRLDVIEMGGGMNIIKTAITGSSGKFHIEGLPEDRRLIVRANYKNAHYHSPLTFDNGKAYAEITVYEPTTSMKDIEVGESFLAFQIVGDQLKSLETITFNNKTSPPKTYTVPEGTFRVSKSPGIIEPPQISITAPDATMPVVQPALESADGKSYYTLYPLKPGVSSFEVQQLLPYQNRNYRYVKRFYLDIKSIKIGVLPQDLMLSGNGVSKIQTDSQNNFSLYAGPPIKEGAEVVWDFSGGTIVPETSTPESAEEPKVIAMPNVVDRNAVMIGSLLLLGFILVLWYAYNKSSPLRVSSSESKTPKQNGNPKRKS
jgi:hypothetical protein